MPQLPVETKWAQALGRDYTHGNTLRSFVDGKTAFEAIHHAIQSTHHRSDFIYLLAWWLDPDVPLLRPNGRPDPKSTLRELLTAKAKAGVQIRVMLWVNWAKKFLPHDSPGDLSILAEAGPARSSSPAAPAVSPIPAGPDLEADYARFLAALQKAPSEDPTAASTPEQSHFRIAKWINTLPGAAAIVDWLTAHVAGSHHQKLVVVRGSEGVFGLCGGVDINADRVMIVERGKGQPLHDVHCEVRGPAAAELVRAFTQRWYAHPWSRTYEEQAPLLGRSVPLPRDVRETPGQIVRVVTTLNEVDPEGLYKVKRRACKLSRGTREALLGPTTSARDRLPGAIASARRFIYLEDQYLTSLDIADALGAAAKNVRYVLALITSGFISDLPQAWRRRKEFIERARSKGLGDKLHVFYLVDPSHSADAQENTYVHSKVWIFDDELAYVGSANANNRGLSSDSELGIFAVDKHVPAKPPYGFAQDLRMKLWKRHLGVEVVDGYNGIDAWTSAPRPQGSSTAPSRVRPYDPDAGKDSKASSRLPWEIIDPDLEGLPECPSMSERARQLIRKAFG